MSDLISRQDAIDVMYKIVERNLDSSVFEDDLSENPHIDVIVDELENLPSAEPKQKTGKWIIKSDTNPYYTTWWYECSECGQYPPIDRYGQEVLSNYCPNCGVRMECEKE